MLRELYELQFRAGRVIEFRQGRVLYALPELKISPLDAAPLRRSDRGSRRKTLKGRVKPAQTPRNGGVCGSDPQLLSQLQHA